MIQWYSCQMSRQTIFQVSDLKTRCRTLELIESADKFSVSERTYEDYPGSARQSPSLCKTSRKHAFLIGGKEVGGLRTDSCIRFDLEAGNWEEMPPMNVARSESSSCALAGFLYVFCGIDIDDDISLSIEKLQLVPSAKIQKWYVWQLIPNINIAPDLTERSFPVVCPLNDREILIMGGHTGKEYLNDVLVYDTRSDMVQVRVPRTDNRRL